MPEPTHNYHLEGTGNTPGLADVSLERARETLGKKLNETSDRLTSVGRLYVGTFTVLDTTPESKYETDEFTVKRQAGWFDVMRVASKKEDLSLYAQNYKVHDYLNLTPAQLNAANDRPPTAGIDQERSSNDITLLLRSI